MIHVHGAAMRRHTIALCTAAATLLVAAPPAHGQASTRAGRRCSECASPSRDSARVRRDRLRLRFDSLRYEFEHERLNDTERERVSAEMHRIVMALQESLRNAEAVGALAAAKAMEASGEHERMRIAPEITVAVQAGARYRTRGYLGVSFDGPSIEIPRRNERIIRFLDYPRIALVEPSSPAERAGILQGDTLLAFNGNDVREREISLTKLLVPEQRITVRVRRDGSPRDLRVTVERAPDYVISRTTPMPAMPPVAPMPGQAHVYPPGEPLPRRAPMPTIVGPGAAGVGTIWIYSDGIAGAQVETLTEGLGRAVGAKSGVLVIRARPGTPAYRSGLRDGDVILRVSGKPVSSVRELRSVLVDGDGDEGVKLAILRERKEREVTLRW